LGKQNKYDNHVLCYFGESDTSLLSHLLEILRLVTRWVAKRCCLYPKSCSLERCRRSSWVFSAAISL